LEISSFGSIAIPAASLELESYVVLLITKGYHPLPFELTSSILPHCTTTNPLLTCNFADGLSVPIPTLPLIYILPFIVPPDNCKYLSS